MRNESILLLATSVLFGCQSGPSESLTVYIDVAEDTITVVEALATNGASLQESQVPGYYTGKFTNVELNPSDEHIAANRITLIIEAFHDGMVIGKSVVAGNERPFSGTYQRTDGIYQVRAEEPGDDRYDGVFTFTISDSMFPLRGDWRANDQSLKGNHKRYGLEKKIFRYNPSLALPNRVSGSYVGENAEIDELGEAELITEDVLRVNPSMQLLINEDVENMYKADLEILRNSIYARHGYSFKNKRIRKVFDQNVAWYVPVSTDVRAELTSLEVKNIDLIKRYEEHADRYYDTFGR